MIRDHTDVHSTYTLFYTYFSSNTIHTNPEARPCACRAFGAHCVGIPTERGSKKKPVALTDIIDQKTTRPSSPALFPILIHCAKLPHKQTRNIQTKMSSSNLKGNVVLGIFLAIGLSLSGYFISLTNV